MWGGGGGEMGMGGGGWRAASYRLFLGKLDFEIGPPFPR